MKPDHVSEDPLTIDDVEDEAEEEADENSEVTLSQGERIG
jgi:hypothetical protein